MIDRYSDQPASSISTLIGELAALGYKAVDMDDAGWSEYRWISDPSVVDGAGVREWVWQEERVRDLLSADDADVLFVGGCASNQWQFYAQFDHIVLLSAPVPVMVERLATRTTNSFGKDPAELARILDDQANVEPRLRSIATVELDTRAPVGELVTAVVALVGRSIE